jgi:tetratricopeptide (TPR) repeat protein
MPIISERSEMIGSVRFSAVLIFSFFPILLFGQIADSNSPAQPENENSVTATGPLNANGSALPQSAGDVRQHVSDTLAETNPQDHANLDVGAIDLPSLANDPTRSGDPRFTISVSSLAAPEKARNAFNKGEEEARKGKIQAAFDYFKQAITTYPRFALAWLELGRLQARQSSFRDAQESFRQAVKNDSSLTTGYLGFAEVAAQQQNWQAVAQMTDALVQRFPESSPVYWFLNSAAYYNLGKMKEAESSITTAVRLDPHHQVPQLEYLYGLIMGNKKDYKSAAEHISNYLRLAPNSPDSLTARQVLAAYQQRAEMADDEQN